MTRADQAWATLDKAAPRTLTELFAADPDRLERLTVEQAGIVFDFSKTHLDAGLVEGLVALADAVGFSAARDALLRGDEVNVTEGRAAEHPAERGMGAPESAQRAALLHDRMRALIDAVEAGALGAFSSVLHIGIGGSALGPALLIEALARDTSRYDVAVVSNVDGLALETVFHRFDPHATLVVIASKTFTTAETLLNAASAIEWMSEAGVADPYGRLVAATADPDAAVAFGIDETRVLPFAESIGGRYSLWSSVGFAAALAVGWNGFQELLEGAAALDRHFKLTPLERNAPVLAAFVDLYYAVIRGAETRGVFAYDERLRLLPPYLQQLEMESNGKSVTSDGHPLTRPSAAITWGGVGTDAQHAVFQLLHQGTHLVPVEFIVSVEPGDNLDPAHHRMLLANCFAQAAALMAGGEAEDPARRFAGNRPSTTILLDRIDPARLGALLAFYEHRTFTVATLLGINPFDQFGVELGKRIAKSIEAGEGSSFDRSTQALIARAGLDHD
jgi:glucose-6-phosphate isomerase